MGNGASSPSRCNVKKPIVFVDFDEFKSHGSLPRNPECDKICKEMKSINRNNAVIVFVSHAWIYGIGNSPPCADDSDHNKYKLIVNGVSKLMDECGEKFKKCYLWVDYCCLNQDEHPAEQLNQLDTIINFSDCLFTPLLKNVETELSYTVKYADTPKDGWNTPGSGYINRAWCRTEMFYGCNIDTYEDNDSRISKLSKSLNHFSNIGRRPHYVYGLHEDKREIAPVLLQLLQNPLLKELDPEYGQVSLPEDNAKIMELMTNLKDHIDKRSEGYYGETRNKKMHGKGLVRFNSGAMYQGDFFNGKKHGTGIFVYASGDVYTGGWVDDMKHGLGEFRNVNGNRYKGNFKLDRRNGVGIYNWTSGDSYDGMWVDDKRHGKGLFLFKDGGEYCGDYFENNIEGDGEMKYTNGDKYAGEFVDGIRYGHGVMHFANGDIYEGQFINDAMQGKGKYTTAEGHEIYEGSFYDNERNGRGSCQYVDGVYDGHWLDGQRHGEGTFTSSNGQDSYTGDWLHGLKHGHGTYKSADGTYCGQYQGGKLHGKGNFTYPNGDVYEGVWLHDKKQGKGTYTYADGRKWIAMWRDDELIEKVAVD